jgi:hypothetical protein
MKLKFYLDFNTVSLHDTLFVILIVKEGSLHTETFQCKDSSLRSK